MKFLKQIFIPIFVVVWLKNRFLVEKYKIEHFFEIRNIIAMNRK